MMSLSEIIIEGRYLPRRRSRRKLPEHLGQNKNNFRVGSTVLVAEKINYKNGKLTKGKVIKILSPGKVHPRGIKVILDSGKIGRVQDVLEY